jgi:hypothetical protein
MGTPAFFCRRVPNPGSANLQMHLLVENVDDWHANVLASDVVAGSEADRGIEHALDERPGWKATFCPPVARSCAELSLGMAHMSGYHHDGTAAVPCRLHTDFFQKEHRAVDCGSQTAGSLSDFGWPACKSGCVVHISVNSWSIAPLWTRKSPEICAHTAKFSPRSPKPDTLLTRLVVSRQCMIGSTTSANWNCIDDERKFDEC